MLVTFPADNIPTRWSIGMNSTLTDFPRFAASSGRAIVGVVLIVLMFATRILACSAFSGTCGHLPLQRINASWFLGSQALFAISTQGISKIICLFLKGVGSLRNWDFEIHQVPPGVEVDKHSQSKSGEFANMSQEIYSCRLATGTDDPLRNMLHAIGGP